MPGSWNVAISLGPKHRKDGKRLSVSFFHVLPCLFDLHSPEDAEWVDTDVNLNFARACAEPVCMATRIRRNEAQTAYCLYESRASANSPEPAPEHGSEVGDFQPTGSFRL